MKLSYQYHQASGKKNKKWFISRYQSFHGSTSDTVSIGDKKTYVFLKISHQNLGLKFQNIIFIDIKRKMSSLISIQIDA